MVNCLEEAKKFDYVFADLTDIPISQTPQVFTVFWSIFNYRFGAETELFTDFSIG